MHSYILKKVKCHPQPSNYLLLIYHQFTKNYTVSKHKICVLPRCFKYMYTRYISSSSVLCLAHILCLLTLRPQRKRISWFSRQTKKALPMSTLIENNAENEEILSACEIISSLLLFHSSAFISDNLLWMLSFSYKNQRQNCLFMSSVTRRSHAGFSSKYFIKAACSAETTVERYLFYRERCISQQHLCLFYPYSRKIWGGALSQHTCKGPAHISGYKALIPRQLRNAYFKWKVFIQIFLYTKTRL